MTVQSQHDNSLSAVTASNFSVQEFFLTEIDERSLDQKLLTSGCSVRVRSLLESMYEGPLILTNTPLSLILVIAQKLSDTDVCENWESLDRPKKVSLQVVSKNGEPLAAVNTIMPFSKCFFNNQDISGLCDAAFETLAKRLLTEQPDVSNFRSRLLSSTLAKKNFWSRDSSFPLTHE